jgi:hypothetical protein
MLMPKSSTVVDKLAIFLLLVGGASATVGAIDAAYRIIDLFKKHANLSDWTFGGSAILLGMTTAVIAVLFASFGDWLRDRRR